MAAALHIKLLTDISNELDKDSPEYENFVFHMTDYVPKGLLKNKRTLLAKFDAMKSRGSLDVGKYKNIMKVAESSGNNEIVTLIQERQTEIIEELAKERKGLKPESSMSTRSKGAGTVVTRKRKLEEEVDQSDPLYGVDSRGKGKYDTTGKKGYLLILNNTYKRLGTGNDIKKLQSLFRDELNFEVKTVSEDLTKDSLWKELQAAREKLINDTQRKYYAFICTILTHGNKTGLQCSKGGVIKINEIKKHFCESNVMSNFAGRPKLFFIESCRGGGVQGLHEVDDADDLGTGTNVDMSDDIVHIPCDADTLLACSSTKGYGSYGDSTSSNTQYTYFIKALCDIFKSCYKADHVEDMLISVREKIALDEYYVYDTDENKYTRQMPCTLSTLTKRLYLTP